MADPHSVTLGAEFDRALEQAKHGIPDGLTALYIEFNPGLVRYLVARVGADGEDVAADVWVAVAPKIVVFEGDESGFRAWLFGFARRRLLDLLRKRHRRGDTATSIDDVRPRSSDDPADEVLGRLSAIDASKLIAHHLSADQSDVILLRVLGGLDSSQVAEVMGRPVGWVRVTQHRGLRRLAGRLGSEMGVAQ